MTKPVTALELWGEANYSIYMRYGGGQLICHIETPERTPENSARFMQELNSRGVVARKNNKTSKVCANTTKLCDHSSCFGMAVEPLTKTIPAVWEAASTLYGNPRVLRILTAGPENPVFEWTAGQLSHHFAHRDPANYLPTLKQLGAFKSIQLQAGNRVDMTLAPGATLDSALQEAHRVLAAH